MQDELETVFVKDTNVTGVGRKAFYGSEKIKVVKLGSQNRYIENKKHFFDCEKSGKEYIYRILQMTLRMMRLMDVILW